MPYVPTTEVSACRTASSRPPPSSPAAPPPRLAPPRLPAPRLPVPPLPVPLFGPALPSCTLASRALPSRTLASCALASCALPLCALPLCALPLCALPLCALLFPGTGSPGRYPPARAIRCASTSLSVSDTNSAPSAISLARNSSAFSMIPLWTTATGPTICGCALMSFGSPCVAHLVCPMPGPPLNRAGRLDPSPATRVLALCTRRPPERFTTASPAESYPRYSSWASPSSRMGTQSRLPTCATIPHTSRSLLQGQTTYRSAVDDTAKLPQ